MSPLKKYNFWNIIDGGYRDTHNKYVWLAISELKEQVITPISDSAVSSVEMNMFRVYWKEAFEIGIDHHIISIREAFNLLEKVEEMVRRTPYTNWSGD
jgi:hypothetical protein